MIQMKKCALLLRSILFGSVWFFACPVEAQLANSPPVPLWIVGTGSTEKSFEWSGKLLKAILFTASDGKAEIIINGNSAGSIEGREKATSLDVTSLIREGSNSLVIKSTSTIAALLELNGDLARKQWITSDATWRTGSDAVAVRGAADADPTTNPFDFKKTFDAYNSWQLAKPGNQNQATDPASLILPPGFKAELIRSSQPGEDSWVSMAFDPEGRITLGREKKGLLRLTLSGGGDQKIETIEDTLLECRGLLYAQGFLFANANNSKALFKLRDTNGDGVFEEKTELLRTEGGVGHGRNHIKLGPDGKIYIAHGNNVLVPKSLSPASPLKNYAEDQLIPNPWDGTMFDGDVQLPAGHILRMNTDGTNVELFAGGLRNPLDIAFHRDGALFTFDADMERDVGTPWYMPTRVLHVVPGADFGWRRGTGRFPDWYIDTLPSVIDIGLSSPTATFFGYGAEFPARYQDAYYIMDWSYGRIIAVHLKKKGTSYTGEQETFVSGRPLNVTGGCIGPDRAMWFITGGRGTQSGLYRVTFSGGSASPSQVNAKALQGPDRFALHAARLQAESTASERSMDQVTSFKEGPEALSNWLIAVRSGNPALIAEGIRMALALPWEKASLDEKLGALRVLAIGFSRGGTLIAEQQSAAIVHFESRFPSADPRLNRELCRTLVYFKSSKVIEKTLPLLKATTTSEDLLFYPFMLRHLKEDWTLEARRVCFTALNLAEKLNGASTYFKAISDTRSELAAALSPTDAKTLASVIFPPKPTPLLPTAMPGHSFKKWKLADLAPKLDQVSRGRSFEKAKAALVSTQCVFCHKVSSDPTLPAGIFGPDLTQVSARFNRQDLLMHILEPSKFIDEKFKLVTVTKKDGSAVTGSLDSEDDERITLRQNPLAADTTEIGKSMIRSRQISDISPMPPGLLNTLKAEQILDLLAWFEAGGDPKHKAFQP
jgi:putative heme-binding domain-containing protein